MTRAGWAGNTGRSGFSEQMHHLWQTRPTRLRHHGPVAGVAAGFGRRYGVDPVLVRVAFVVSTIFGGSGIILYLLAWLLCPAAQDQVSAAEGLFGRGHSTQSPAKTVLLIIVLVIAVSTVGPVGAGLGGAGLISFVLMLAGWWLLYLRSPQPPVDEYDTPLPDGGFGTTGYPGAMFPDSSPWSWTSYGPYTKLPDHYEPDQPNHAATETLSPQDSATEVIRDSPSRAADTAVPHDETSITDEAADSPPTIPTETSGEPANSRTSTPGAARTSTGSTASQRISSPPPPFRTTPNPSDIHPTPSGWDPLGVNPLTWDLPDPNIPRVPATPPLPVRRPRSRLTPIVIGLAILAAAVAGALAAAGVGWMTPGRIGAVALAVVGLGLIIGAFGRRGYGLMVVLAPLAGFVILASLLNGPGRFDRAAMGNHTWAPTAMAELDSAYRVEMGNGTLDLRSLNLTGNRTVHVRVRAGDVRVLVPNSMRLEAKCKATMGDVRCAQGVTGPATGPVLTLDVDVHAGNAEVTHG